MILISNTTHQVIISSFHIVWKDSYYEAGNTRYFNGLSPSTHTIIDSVVIPYGNPDWWIYQNGEFVLTESGLNIKKNAKRNEIRTTFESVENDPVEVNSTIWNGGYESAQKLDGAKRMAELLSQTSVTFYDVDNIGHSLTIPEAEVIITTIGIDYQTKFANKQAKMVAIDNATTLNDLDSIVW